MPTQMACLVAATHKVLGAWIRDDDRLVAILAQHVGQGASPLLRGMLRLTSWLTFDPFAVATGRLKGLANDYGRAFDGLVDKDTGCGVVRRGGVSQNTTNTCRRAELQLRRCLYREVFVGEECPQLLAATCCSQDVMWFEHLKNVSFSLEKDQQGCCRLICEKQSS